MFFSKIRKLISQPYPFYFRGRSLWIILGLVFIISVAFNYLFEPFIVNTKEHKMPYFWICAVHSFNAIAAVLLMVLILFFTRPSYDNWTVGKDLMFLFFVLLFIGIAQFLVRDLIYDNPRNWSTGYLLEEVRNTFLIGGLIIIILVSLNFNRLYYQNKANAQAIKLNPSINIIKQSPGTFFLSTQLKADDFELDLERFLYARSDKNYVEFFLSSEEDSEKLLKRMTIKELDRQLASLKKLFRCHRSYLVNLEKIQGVEGNAQGYRLKLRGSEHRVPVSRNLIREFEDRMKELSA